MAARGQPPSMGGEASFRTVAATLFVSALSISAYHRRKADQVSDKVSWKEEGVLAIAALRVSGLGLWLSVLAYLLNPRWMHWSRLPVPTWMRWLGAGMSAMMLPLFYWLFSSIGKNITPTVATRKEHRLITHGPYRWVRHPLYAVGSLFSLGLSLLAANWFMGLTSLSTLLLLMVRLPKEEAKLLERFGDVYRAYMQRTGRLLPRLRR
jgi:protein-S-isoprenylcysteine O-methyltransferase Ste14